MNRVKELVAMNRLAFLLPLAAAVTDLSLDTIKIESFCG
jgi:hypothetical protein